MKAAVNHNLAGLPEEMEECMDDVFLDVWEHIERFDAAKGSFRNWIISIARFRSIDYLRRYSRTCMEEDVSNYESKLARNDRIDTLEQEISTETEKLLEGLKEEERPALRFTAKFPEQRRKCEKIMEDWRNMYDGDIRGFKSGSFRGRIYGISRDGNSCMYPEGTDEAS